MAEIDIFSLQPSTISRDLSGKSFLIYGTRKSGKTSNAVKFPKPLVMGFEKGWNMLSVLVFIILNVMIKICGRCFGIEKSCRSFKWRNKVVFKQYL